MKSPMISAAVTRGARSRRAALALAALFLGGCFPRDPNPADTTLIDSVMAPSPEVVVDSVIQIPPRADASGNLTGETTRRGDGSGQAPPSDIIGRDSAFGPIGTIDSLGKIEPIRR
ncbi:MAG: hypothetical protein ACSLFK_12780 [Gemmatimonadaceae bacterium]